MATDYVRFVILSWGRTGSTYLVKELNARPDTVTESELFHPSTDGRDRARGQRWENGTDSWNFVQENVFFDRDPAIRAVGFKLFYFHARKGPDEQAIWRALREDRSIRIILLGRRNVFAGFVSEQRARQTSIWHPRPGQEGYYAPVELALDVEAAERYLRLSRERAAMGQSISKGHPAFGLDYEDLLEDHVSILARMARFLDLPVDRWQPGAFLESSADRDRTRITNLKEVQEMLERNDAGWMAQPFLFQDRTGEARA